MRVDGDDSSSGMAIDPKMPTPIVDDFEEEGDVQKDQMLCFLACSGLFKASEPAPIPEGNEPPEPLVQEVPPETPIPKRKTLMQTLGLQ